jgi:hypothetical protein
MRPELVTALLELFAPKPVKNNCPPKKEKLKMSKSILVDVHANPIAGELLDHRQPELFIDEFIVPAEIPLP